MTQYKKFAKVEGHPNLLRDLQTNAIINTDSSSSTNYSSSRNKIKEEKESMNQLKSDVEGLKSSVDEIKQLLRSIINAT
jgi:hypothetical protein